MTAIQCTYLKSSLCIPFSCVIVLFQSCFLGYLEKIRISHYAFSERLKFAVFKIGSINSRHLNEDKHRQFKNKELQVFENNALLL